VVCTTRFEGNFIAIKLLQEIVNIYPAINPPSLSAHQSNRFVIVIISAIHFCIFSLDIILHLIVVNSVVFSFNGAEKIFVKLNFDTMLQSYFFSYFLVINWTVFEITEKN